MKFPSYLKKGDTIGILCPSGYIPLDKVQICIETLHKWGYTVFVGKTVGHQNSYFSGTDDERLLDLQQMLNDANIKAILCARGGYGLSRIIDKIDFKYFIKNPKWIVGYSDVTLLHSHINTNLKIATLHSPMAAAFNDDGYKNEYVTSLQKALKGNKAKYSCNPHHLNKTGKVTAELVGGNLCMMAHSIGSTSSYKTKNKILFIEDIGEYIYNIDRMLWQLKRAGFFENILGIVVGGFTDIKDTTIPFGKTIEEVLAEHFNHLNIPIAYHFPVGHQTKNYALKIGGTYTLTITNKQTTLAEI
ncbi:MAG: LD-carboxypeptidase [Bacteroidetes bacterium]|nr:LD-carboxypeptidase [Bacteroidota bacterium]